MSDILNEIEDDLRRQKMNEFWQENRNWIIGGIILAIVSTAALTFWRSYEYNKNVESTAALMSVAAQPDVEALTGFANEADADHAAMAQFMAASLHLQKGESQQAIALYDKIASTSGVAREFRDLASLYSIGQRLSADEPAKLHRELAPLAKDKNPWRFSAREMQALLYAREGKMTEAADTLSLISGDAAAPQDVRTRAFTLHELYMGNAMSAGAQKK